MKTKLPADLRARLAAHGWCVSMLFQPQWRFRPGPRKLSRVPEPTDPWEAWLVTEADSVLGRAAVAHAVGDTAEQAVLNAIEIAMPSAPGILGAIFRLGEEMQLTAATVAAYRLEVTSEGPIRNGRR